MRAFAMTATATLAVFVVFSLIWPRPTPVMRIETSLQIRPLHRHAREPLEQSIITRLLEQQAEAVGLRDGMHWTFRREGAATNIVVTVDSRSPTRDTARIARWLQAVQHAVPAYVAGQSVAVSDDSSPEELDGYWRNLRTQIDNYLAVTHKFVQEQIAMHASKEEPSTIPVSTPVPIDHGESAALNPQWLELSDRMEREREALNDLLKKYTSRHPEVVKARQRVEALANELDRVPMLAPPNSTAAESAHLPAALNSPGPELHHRPEDVENVLTELDVTERDLDAALDAYARARTSLERAAARSGEWWFVDVQHDPLIVERQGGLKRTTWWMMTCASLAVGLLIHACGIRRRYGVLTNVVQLADAWGANIIGVVGNIPGAKDDAPWTERAYRATGGLLFLICVTLAVMAMLDAAFLHNMVHDPRLAITEFWRAVTLR